MVRLRDRLKLHTREAESLAGMVQVLRFCGLPEHSLRTAAQVQELDPTLRTSVPHTLFVLSRYPETIESYSGRTGYYLDAAAWAALNNKAHAAGLLRERLANAALSQLMSGLMQSLLALVEGRDGDALALFANDRCRARTGGAVLYVAALLLYRSSRRGYRDIEGSNDFRLCSVSFNTAFRSVAGICARRHSGFDAVLSTAAAAAAQAESLFQQASV